MPANGDLLSDAEKTSNELVCFPSAVSLLQADTWTGLC